MLFKIHRFSAFTLHVQILNWLLPAFTDMPSPSPTFKKYKSSNILVIFHQKHIKTKLHRNPSSECVPIRFLLVWLHPDHLVPWDTHGELHSKVFEHTSHDPPREQPWLPGSSDPFWAPCSNWSFHLCLRNDPKESKIYNLKKKSSLGI